MDPLALLCLQPDHWLRKPVVRLVRWRPFDWIMLLVILANCVTLAMQSNQPGFEDSDLGISLMQSEYFFVGSFAVEMILKIIALGFISGEHTYLHSGEWNA